MRWRFWRRKVKPHYEYRIIVCNRGSIFAGDKSAWYENPQHPAMVEFIEKHADIPMHACRFISHEAWAHSRHLMIEERTSG